MFSYFNIIAASVHKCSFQNSVCNIFTFEKNGCKIPTHGALSLNPC